MKHKQQVKALVAECELLYRASQMNHIHRNNSADIMRLNKKLNERGNALLFKIEELVDEANANDPNNMASNDPD